MNHAIARHEHIHLYHVLCPTSLRCALPTDQITGTRAEGDWYLHSAFCCDVFARAGSLSSLPISLLHLTGAPIIDFGHFSGGKHGAR